MRGKRGMLSVALSIRAGMAAILFFLCCTQVHALDVEQPLPDAAQEARARALFHELRCVVCQGETLADSSAEVASDMRREIRAQVAAGKGDDAIKAYFVERYGEFVLMRPPVESAPLLWLLPLFIVIGAAACVACYFRRRGV